MSGKVSRKEASEAIEATCSDDSDDSDGSPASDSSDSAGFDDFSDFDGFGDSDEKATGGTTRKTTGETDGVTAGEGYSDANSFTNFDELEVFEGFDDSAGEADGVVDFNHARVQTSVLPLPDAGSLPGFYNTVSVECLPALLGNRFSNFRAQSISYQIYWTMKHCPLRDDPAELVGMEEVFLWGGTDIEPMPAELEALLDRIGCFPAFTEGSTENLIKDATSFNKRPNALRLLPILPCKRCHYYHLNKVDWNILILRESGRLSDDDLERLAAREIRVYAICGNTWCINATHLTLEDAAGELSRETCITESDEDHVCQHTPECMPEEYMEAEQLAEVVDKLQTYHATLKAQVLHCPACNKPFRGLEFIMHMVNEHFHVPIPPLHPQALAYRCANAGCGKNLVGANAVAVCISPLPSATPATTVPASHEEPKNGTRLRSWSISQYRQDGRQRSGKSSECSRFEIDAYDDLRSSAVLSDPLSRPHSCASQGDARQAVLPRALQRRGSIHQPFSTRFPLPPSRSPTDAVLG